MKNKNVNKTNRGFKILMWLYLTCAILCVFSIVRVLITKEITVLGYVMGDLNLIIDSLVLAFICGNIKATTNGENK